MEYVNEEEINTYKDLALFSRKRIHEIKNNANALPNAPFAQFSLIYGKWINWSTLRNEFIRFCQIYDTFDKTMTWPKKLYNDKRDSEDNTL